MVARGESATLQRRDGWAILTLRGEIDIANADRMIRDPLDEIENTDHGLIVDLAEVRYLDSAGMRSLIGARSDLAERRQVVALVLPEGSLLRRALEVGGLLELLRAYPNVDAAIAGDS